MINAFKKIYAYRSILLATTKVELRGRYSGSLLGISWAIIGPMLLVSLYALIYTFVFRVRPVSLSVPLYILYVVSGLIPFLSFAQSLGAGATGLRAKKQVLLSTVFPFELIPVRLMLVTNVTLIAGMAFISTVSLFFKPPSIWLMTLPLVIIAQVLFTIGVTWIISLISIVIQDIQHMIQYIVIMFLIITPIAYTPDMVPEGLSALIHFNPLYYFTSAYQSLIVYSAPPPIFNVLVGLVLSLLVFSSGYYFFMKAKDVVVDYA